jgi:hypothetical protein
VWKAGASDKPVSNRIAGDPGFRRRARQPRTHLQVSDEITIKRREIAGKRSIGVAESPPDD